MTIKEYMGSNRQNIIDDIKALVCIRSVKSDPKPGAPFGDGVRAAQLKAMELCQREGFLVHDADGVIAYAHYGREDKFLGIIAHVDVVPEGDGWDTPPYECAERDGFLVGRGVGDDKGSLVLGLWAAKYLIESGAALNYGIRLIIGLDEESGMADAEYYVKHFPEPVFTFTPDSDFPVCHGEKGIYQADLVSKDLGESLIKKLHGGVASNVVPDSAAAVLDIAAKARMIAAAEGNAAIAVGDCADGVEITASGISAHAGTPHSGVSAIHILLRFLLNAGVLNEKERAAAAFLADIAGDFSGKSLGIDSDDKKFTPLSVIAGMIQLENRRLTMNLNSRYPTSIAPEEVAKRVEARADAAGFSVANLHNMPPFYIDPESPAVRLLSDIYNEVSGSDAKPYVMAGGTYARKMKNAVAFGPDFPNRKYPGWVGAAHMKNEAICVDDALLAAEIYAETLLRLQKVEF